MRYLPALDGLRAIAVIAVITYHAGLPVPAGFIGVDIFFVISGYLITRLLHDEVQSTGRIDFLGFYARRARRILPVLVVIILVSMVAAAVVLPIAEQQQALKSGAASLLFAGNLFFYSLPAGYFDASPETMPLLHLWSLGVEEQFYIVWPVVLILTRKHPVKALATLAIASFALSEWLLFSDAKAAFYQMPSRAWELAIGGLVALRPVRVPKGSAWAGLALALLASMVPLAHFPGVGAMPAVLGAALTIAAIQNGERCRILEARPVVWVGLISYSLYLWHWPLLVLGKGTNVGVLVAAAFVLAAISYRYIEVPFRRIRVPPRATVAAAMSIILVGSTTAFTSAARMDTFQISATTSVGLSEVYTRGCDDWYKSAQIKPCIFGDKDADRTAVIMGDSIGLQWFPAANKALAGWRVIVLTKSACPMVDEPFVYPRIGREYTECEQWRKAALKYAAAQDPDMVIMGSNWNYGFTQAQWIDGTARIIDALGRNTQIRIIRATPPYSGPSPENENVFRLQQQVANRYTNVRTVDLNDFVCPGNKCNASAYRDAQHLRAQFAESISDEFGRRLNLN